MPARRRTAARRTAPRRRAPSRKPARRKPVAAALIAVDPYIRVKNVRRSTDWYKRMLGFTLEMAMPNRSKPAFARMSGGPGGVSFMIGDGSDAASGKKAPAALSRAMASRQAQKVVSFYFRVARGIDSLYDAVRRKRAVVVSPLQRMDYGMKEFTIKDPDGYNVSVGQAVR